MIEGLKSKKVVQATCFGAHNAVLTDAGQVFMWGSGTVRRSPSLTTSSEGNGPAL
jgi:alpha-tubulin suppressor-like RCC1 family protein